jgi:hypothetical protein
MGDWQRYIRGKSPGGIAALFKAIADFSLLPLTLLLLKNFQYLCQRQEGEGKRGKVLVV